MYPKKRQIICIQTQLAPDDNYYRIASKMKRYVCFLLLSVPCEGYTADYTATFVNNIKK